MLVFTLPSYDVVFKLIRDRSMPPKDIDRCGCDALLSDWFSSMTVPGRLVEAHEFEHLRIASDASSSSLLAVSEARGRLLPSGWTASDVVIAHVYVERRVWPLNLPLPLNADASDGDRRSLRLRV